MDYAAQLTAYQKSLYKQARKYTYTHEAAEDLVQQTYLNALEALKRGAFDGANLGGWLNRILYNTFVNSYRSKKRRQNVNISVDSESVNAPVTVEPAGQTASLVARDAFKAIAGLSEKKLACLKAVVLNDMPYEEASKLLGIPVNSIKTNVRRCRLAVEEAIA